MATEQHYIDLLNAGIIRLVHSKRARVLRKKGVRVRWCQELYGYVWWPKQEQAHD